MTITAEQRELRRKYIGGSDAAAACGVSKWCSPYQLGLNKQGQREITETPQMAWGSRLEPLIRSAYEEMTGDTVIVPEHPFFNDAYPWAIANLDGLSVTDAVWEAKTARDNRFWHDESGEPIVPDDYVFQVQHYMAVCDLDRAIIAVLFGGSDLQIRYVDRDQELIDYMMVVQESLWELIQRGELPDPETEEDVRHRWRKSIPDKAMEANKGVQKLVKQLHGTREKIEVLKELEAETTLAIKKLMEDAEALVVGDEVLVTWKSSAPVLRLDTKQFKEDEPKLYAQYSTEKPGARRFLLKKEKE